MPVFTLLETTSTEEQLNYVGKPIRAAGWYGYTQCLQTIAVFISNFTGRIFIEGTLNNDPNQTTDWFPIQLNGSDYLEFPNNPIVGNSIFDGDTGVYGYTFRSNLLYIRARVFRSYFITDPVTPDQIMQLGAVQKIDLCF